MLIALDFHIDCHKSIKKQSDGLLQNGTMHHQNELVLQIFNTVKHFEVTSVEFACLKHTYSSLIIIFYVNT